jgi:ubiquinone/menaquinone biosynthesis C-methylase UbiE
LLNDGNLASVTSMSKEVPVPISCEKTETDRIQEEYARRDAEGYTRSVYSYTNPAFQFLVQEREWALMTLLRENCFNLQGSDVLEVGCGTGHILQRFMEFGARSVTGVDLMLNRLREGKHHYPVARFVLGNASQLPFVDEHFDLVTQFTCFSSVLDNTMRQRIAGEMLRVLKPQGVILFYDLRPIPRLGQILLRVINCRSVKSEKTGWARDFTKCAEVPTPTRPVSREEVMQLFRGGMVAARPISLDFTAADCAGKSIWAARFLSAIPPLRTHTLALIKKSRTREQKDIA